MGKLDQNFEENAHFQKIENEAKESRPWQDSQLSASGAEYISGGSGGGCITIYVG
jgi:hypothetical protein